MDGRIETAGRGDRPRRWPLDYVRADRRVLTLAGMAAITGTAVGATTWTLDGPDGDVAAGTLGERVSGAGLAVVHPGGVVSRALDVMPAAGQGRLPVTGPQSGRPVGLLTREDLLQVHATVVRSEAERSAFFRRGRLERRAGSGA